MRTLTKQEMEHIIAVGYGLEKPQITEKAAQLTEENINAFESNEGPATKEIQARIASIVFEAFQNRTSPSDDVLFLADIIQQLIGDNKIQRKRSAELAFVVLDMGRKMGFTKSPTNPSLKG